jgi:hypothetical protein
MFIAYTHKIPLEKLSPVLAAGIRLAKSGALPLIPLFAPPKQKESA